MTEHAGEKKVVPVGPPLMVRSEPDTSPTASLGDPRNQTALATAITSILVWALAHYVAPPAEVIAAVALVVPAAVAWVGSHLAYRRTPPRLETPVHETEAHP